jgi:hypothetical protein
MEPDPCGDLMVTPKTTAKDEVSCSVPTPPKVTPDEVRAVARKFADQPIQETEPDVWAILTAISKKACLRPQVLPCPCPSFRLLFLFLYARPSWNKGETEKSYLQLMTNNFREFRTLSRVTDGFSEANLLGRGRYGSVYRCTLEEEDEGAGAGAGAAATVAIKVFNLQQSGSSKSFEAECETLRRVRHRCLLKIVTKLNQFLFNLGERIKN